ncbi:universal stress protein [Neptunomonas japonica]|uniref:universal stress protein n=1 Tax=Neptunomonas japonica TaxID=417574 RepID=UPI00041DCF21|nr:universal stress protein [Neptunomonas japonica]
MYKKICVAVDGSESSLAAVKVAAELVSRLGAKLLLLHVIRPMKIPEELQRYIKEDDLAKVRYAALEGVGQEIVANAVEIVKTFDVESLDTVILNGDPASSIVKEAKRQSADLIVLGTRGLGKFEGALIGSISRKVTDISEISLLIVK